MRRRTIAGVLAALACCANAAAAQNWDVDARRIALGGADTTNLASQMLDEQRPYRSIVLPFGLAQVVRDFEIYDPGSSRFNPVRAAEHLAAPLHVIVDRDAGASGARPFDGGVLIAPVGARHRARRGQLQLPGGIPLR